MLSRRSIGVSLLLVAGVMPVLVGGPPAYAGPAALSITASLDKSWVYQNTPVSTGDRHRALLTATVSSDTWGNTSYTTTVTQSGSGLVSLTTVSYTDSVGGVVIDAPARSLSVAGLSLYAAGCRKTSLSSPFADIGLCTLHVEVSGNVGGTASADVVLKVRPLGDVNDDGLVNAVGDKNAVTAAVRAGSTDAQCDINADGIVNAVGDLGYITAIIRGTVIN